MDTILTVAERNSNKGGMVRENRKPNSNREHIVQKFMDTIETVAERNSNRGMVRENQSPVQIGNKVQKLMYTITVA